MAKLKGVIFEDYSKYGTASDALRIYDIIRTRIKGGYYLNAYQFQDILEKGEELLLKRESTEDNLFRVNVYYRKQLLGYLEEDLGTAIKLEERTAKVFEKRNNSKYGSRIDPSRKGAMIELRKI